MRISVKTVLLPILLVNITTSANLWTVAGLQIGQSLYFLAIALAAWRVYSSSYRVAGTLIFLAALVLKAASVLLGSAPLDLGTTVVVGLLFSLAGALVYGRDPQRLHRQLMIFFALSLPILFAQKAGLHGLLLAWNTEVFHENDIYSFDESDLGKLTYVAPLVRTLFVGSEDLTYIVAQGRPSGLLYSNNVLSVFLVLAFALNLFVRPSRVTRWSDAVLALCVPLVMSLTATVASVILSGLGSVLGGPLVRRRVLRIAFFVIGAFGLHYLLFPGLTEAGFSRAKLITSIVGRFGELAYLLNAASLAAALGSQAESIGLRFLPGASEDTSYSMVAIFLKSKAILPLSILLLAGALMYLRRLRALARARQDVLQYGIFVVAAIFTQFAVPYLAAPSFQFLLGFGLAPLLPGVWRERGTTVARGSTSMLVRHASLNGPLVPDGLTPLGPGA